MGAKLVTGNRFSGMRTRAPHGCGCRLRQDDIFAHRPPGHRFEQARFLLADRRKVVPFCKANDDALLVQASEQIPADNCTRIPEHLAPIDARIVGLCRVGRCNQVVWRLSHTGAAPSWPSSPGDAQRL